MRTGDTEIITTAREDGKEIYLVRYQRALWAFCYHDDPGLDFAVDPQGHTCTDIWDPHGPYTHPLIPDELLAQLDELFTAQI